ncbi:hypothetical protein [Haloplasma contractile]|uniref:Uncharacterized protein n=1 Tax=Haloplasma contractile SSD-17B TaxID=1033810 RepID=U2E899_9MOLU|nr:hypothetical protein [Haloplasma contractile]ERJ11413.1 hypothetical protein HLPCO_002535 [Haloplasma contractile SSD-17B]
MKIRVRDYVIIKGRRNLKLRKFYKYSRNFIFVLLIGILLFQCFDAIAFTGKRIINPPSLELGTKVEELFKEGKGHRVDEQIKLTGDVSMTIDGVIIDERRMYVFATLKNVDEMNLRVNMDGFLNHNIESRLYRESGAHYHVYERNGYTTKLYYELNKPLIVDRSIKFKVVMEKIEDF